MSSVEEVPEEIKAIAEAVALSIAQAMPSSAFRHVSIKEMKTRIGNALVADRQRDQWQDISTAPKDGRWIMVCSPDHALPEFAYWDGDGWATGNCGLSPVFTHWCPLPAAPEAGG